MADVSKKTIDKIVEEKIEPKAQWQFLLRDGVVWGIGILSLFFGSLAVAVIIFLLGDHDWKIYRMAEGNFWLQVLVAVPYFWILILVIFAGVVYYNVRHTKRGYKFKTYWIVLISIGFSLFFGSVLYATGFGAKIDDALYSNLKPYRQIIMHRTDMWQKPGAGRLAGKIIEIQEDKNLIVVAFGGQTWQVDVSDAKIHPVVKLEINEIIMMLGKPDNKEYFIATQIMPWKGRSLENKLFLFREMKEIIDEGRIK